MKPITWIQLLIFCTGVGQSRALTAQDFPFRSGKNRFADKPAFNEAGGTNPAFR